MGEDHWLLRWLGGKNKQGIPDKRRSRTTAHREPAFAYPKFSGRGPLHSIQFIALLVIGRDWRDRASFYASRNHATIPGLDLPNSSYCFSLITIWMMFYLLRSHATESLAGLATALLGLLLYFCAGQRAIAHHEKNLHRIYRWFSALLECAGGFAQGNPEVAPRAIPVNTGPNDVARFLAGMPVPENSPLAPLMRDPAWQAHAAFFEEQFSKLNLQTTPEIARMATTYLPESLQPIPVVFYMFSGPDLYVDQFFPTAAVYVLCGKEALGPPPDPLRIANLSGALGNLENAMKSSLNTTYFITKDMKVDLHEQNLNGVLPILYTCIARADKSIANVVVRIARQRWRI